MFITFEGIEGCGKTTQIERLEARLIQRGIPLIRTFEPGGTKIGQNIRRILLDAGNRHLSALTELLLYEADRAQHISEVIKAALDDGKWVICDRFFDATVAYQGAARGQDLGLIKLLNDTVTQGIRPNLTLLLDCPAEVGLERALRRHSAQPPDGQDRFEREKLEFHKKVRAGYLELASGEPERFVVVDANHTEDEIEKQVLRILEPHLKDKGQ
ncbi:dTMP kinase [Thermodesulfobacteriota bacterium]